MKFSFLVLRSFIAIVVTFIFTLVFVSGSSQVFAQDAVLSAVARLQDAQGSTVGSIFFTQKDAKVWVVAQVNDLAPGFHGLQLHSVGQCDAASTPPFASAGAQLDPASAAHPDQAGALPVLLVLQDGTGHLTTITDRFSVADLLDEDGSAVIVHANADNYANIPARYGVTTDDDTLTTGDAGDGVACGVVQTLSSELAAKANLEAMQALPLDNLPATVSRDEGAEHGTLVLTLPALGGMQIQGQIASGAAGQIGEARREGDFIVFTFTEITYDVAPIELPGGLRIGEQGIKLDPSQTSTLRMNVNTGEILRDFHWIQTATDVLYNGEPSIALGDTARAQVAEVQDLGGNRYSVRLLTHWRSVVELETWTIGGTTLPSGTIEATAEFDGIYVLDFNK